MTGKGITLTEGVDFQGWVASLQSQLSKRSLLGYVSFDMEDIEPERRPERRANETDSAYSNRRGHWKSNDLQARGIILERLDDSYRAMHAPFQSTASELYEKLSKSFDPIIEQPCAEATLPLVQSSISGLGIDQYCKQFRMSLSKHLTTVAITAKACNKLESNYRMPDGLVEMFFVNGTKPYEWPRSWRGNPEAAAQTIDGLMNSLKNVTPPAGFRAAGQSSLQMEAAAVRSADPNKRCKDCKHHKHLNKDCFKKNPSLNYKGRERRAADLLQLWKNHYPQTTRSFLVLGKGFFLNQFL